MPLGIKIAHWVIKIISAKNARILMGKRAKEEATIEAFVDVNLFDRKFRKWWERKAYVKSIFIELLSQG